jgi:hypothetical protein
MRPCLKFIPIIAGALLLNGCATLFAGGAETVDVVSEPAGATVTTQHGHTLGVTPFTTRLDPSSEYVLTFQKQGYTPTSYALGRKLDAVTFLNLICLLCWVVDVSTGSMWGLDTNTVSVALSPATAALTPEQRGAVQFGVPAERFLPVQH